MRRIVTVAAFGVLLLPCACDGRAGADASTEAGAEADGDAGPCPSGMVLVPAGPFVMGSDSGEGSTDEEPEHVVTLSPYCIDRTEATNAQWRSCVATGGCTAPGATSSFTRPDYYTDAAYDSHPVVNVDWSQAAAYCGWAGKRLPTEAEWEKAARGGCEMVAPSTCGEEDERTFPWGHDVPTCSLANHGGCVGDTDRVDVRPAGRSPYGALDMAGNVWEWVADWYDAEYYHDCASGCSDPPGPGSSPDGHRVMRGGGWYYDVPNIRASGRLHYEPDYRGPPGGLRCASTP
jgi:formylglycine-generating enzyme required for sulfatase activity